MSRVTVRKYAYAEKPPAKQLSANDEFGIWPYDRESATAFFTLVSARYERDSIHPDFQQRLR